MPPYDAAPMTKRDAGHANLTAIVILVGLIIAFLLPGFTCLCGFSAFSPTLAAWLSAEPKQEPSPTHQKSVVIRG